MLLCQIECAAFAQGDLLFHYTQTSILDQNQGKFWVSDLEDLLSQMPFNVFVIYYQIWKSSSDILYFFNFSIIVL